MRLPSFLKSDRPLYADLLHLFYPHLCVACQGALPIGDSLICLTCNYHLPKTNFHLMAENQLTEQLWGRVPIHHGSAFIYFSKKSGVQQMIHALKYQNRPDIGEFLGAQHGQQLRESPFYQKIDAIVPVPLHWKKLKTRGYNQAKCYAQGLGEAMTKPIAEIISRKEKTSTQTKKSRWHRFQNVASVFALEDDHCPNDQHYLLVDDVMTTGATLEACARRILEIPGSRVSVATIAYAPL